MFLVPFEYGAAWSKSDDNDGGNALVIGQELNQRLFRGENSVGRELPLEGHTYRIHRCDGGVESPATLLCGCGRTGFRTRSADFSALSEGNRPKGAYRREHILYS